VNIVLQLRWLDLPEKADLIQVTFVRNIEYFKSWKGDPKKTGGLFYNLFIHYIDLSIQLDARFEGIVLPTGEQIRKVDSIDILNINMDELYVRMYDSIVTDDSGVKPKDLFFLHWMLNRHSEEYGFGADAMNKKIEIKELGGVDVTHSSDEFYRR